MPNTEKKGVLCFKIAEVESVGVKVEVRTSEVALATPRWPRPQVTPSAQGARCGRSTLAGTYVVGPAAGFAGLYRACAAGVCWVCARGARNAERRTDHATTH